jgi:hypothetical protein
MLWSSTLRIARAMVASARNAGMTTEMTGTKVLGQLQELAIELSTPREDGQ